MLRSQYNQRPEFRLTILTAQSIIIATGLIALVDDSIQRRWHRRRGMQFALPMPMRAPFKLNMEYIGPKRLIDEVFNRRGNTATRQYLQ